MIYTILFTYNAIRTLYVYDENKNKYEIADVHGVSNHRKLCCLLPLSQIPASDSKNVSTS